MLLYRKLCVVLSAVIVASDVQGANTNKRQVHFTHRPDHHPTLPTGASHDPLTSWIGVAKSSQSSSVLPSLSPSSSSSSLRPNVLFLVVDDLLPRLGCYGNDMLVTPNIDQLASKSVLFQRAYAQQALCGPSRTSFLTGRRPDSTRVYDLHTYWRNVAGNFTTLPQFFKDHGYHSQGVGKIFHPGNSGMHDDSAYSWSETNYRGQQPVSYEKRHENTVQPVDETVTGPLQDTTIADFAVSWIHNRSLSSRQDPHQHQPFFLAVGFHKPHLPFLFPKQFKALYPLSHLHLAKHRTKPRHTDDIVFSGNFEFNMFHDIQNFNLTDTMDPLPDQYQLQLRQAYSSAISFTDGLVGRVLEALSQSGFADNTVISFHGDHGYHLGDNAMWGKHTNYEATTRIPMMLHVPGVTSADSHFRYVDALSNAAADQSHDVTRSRTAAAVTSLATDALVEAVDLFPTLAELAGLQAPDTCPEDNLRVLTCVEGTSLVPLLRNVISGPSPGNGGGVTSWKDAAFSQFVRHTSDNSTVMGYSVRTTQHRYAEWVQFDPVNFRADWTQVVARELYVHSQDPDEFHNAVDRAELADTAQTLSNLLRAGWRTTLNNYLNAQS